jgi:hypothetical protein
MKTPQIETSTHYALAPFATAQYHGKRRRPVTTTQVCDYGHDHPASDWSYDDCQLYARIERARAHTSP